MKTKFKAKLIEPNGKTTEVEPKNGKDFSLEELQKFVGGYIECIYPDSKTVMILNENGKIDNLPYNDKATTIAKVWPHDVIVGTVLVCGKNQIK